MVDDQIFHRFALLSALRIAPVDQHYQIKVLVLRQLIRIFEIAAVCKRLRQLLKNPSSIEFAVTPATGADCDLFMFCNNKTSFFNLPVLL